MARSARVVERFFCEGRMLRPVVSKLALGLTVCSVLAPVGCSRKVPPKPETSPTESPTVNVVTEVPSDPVEGLIHNIVQHCTFNETHAVISKCANNEKQSAIRDFNTGKLSRAEALPKLVAALAGPDKKRSVTASKLLESAFRNSLGTVNPAEVNKQAAAELVKLLSTLPERQASQVAPVTVHAAMLTGQQTALYKALDEHPNPDLRATAYVYLLRYGTLAELPKIQSLVEGKEEKVAASAVDALRRMPGRKPEDIKQICEFVKPLVEDQRVVVAGKATAQLVTCGGEYLDAALSAAHKRQKDATLSAPVVRGFDQTCTMQQGKSAGTEPQCNSLRMLLTQSLGNTKLNEETRQFSLLGLGMQFQDETTLKLAEKYINTDEKRIKTAAERVIRSVGGRLKSKGTVAGPTGAPRLPPTPPKAVGGARTKPVAPTSPAVMP